MKLFSNYSFFAYEWSPNSFESRMRNGIVAFTRKWCGNGGPLLGPARLPDLTPLVFYLRRRIKVIVYSSRNKDNLKSSRNWRTFELYMYQYYFTYL